MSGFPHPDTNPPEVILGHGELTLHIVTTDGRQWTFTAPWLENLTLQLKEQDPIDLNELLRPLRVRRDELTITATLTPDGNGITHRVERHLETDTP